MDAVIMIKMLIKGLIIGVIASAPVGPVAVMCVQRTLNGGRGRGIATALGSSCSDLLYAIIAVFSMSMVVSFIEEYKLMLQIIGTIVVFFFGLRIFRNNPANNLQKVEESMGYHKDFSSAFILTFTNPMVIFLFIFLFAKFTYVREDNTLLMNILGIAFIMLGATFWWTFIVAIVNHFRGRFNVRGLYIVNRATGIILMAIAPISLIISLL